MKPASRVFTISLLLVASACSKKPADTDLHRGHAATGGEPASEKTWTKPAKKFVADDSLKMRMSRVLEIATAMHDAGSKTTAESDTVTAGKKIEATVQDIFKNCKLAPDADAAIHPILGELLNGAALLKQGDKKGGHEIIHKALLRYEDHFIHPGWNH